MNYHDITKEDMNNGDGIRVVLWVAGCDHHCKGCQNKQTWDYNSGIEFDDEAKKELIEALSKPYIKGLTLSGGDPLCAADNNFFFFLCDLKRQFPDKDIWLWTGNRLSSLKENSVEQKIVSLCDYVVDGIFIEDLSKVKLRFRGSSNQHIWRNNNGSFEIASDIENNDRFNKIIK